MFRCPKVASTTEKDCSGDVFAIQWLPSLLHPQVALAARPRPDFLVCSASCVFQLSARRPPLPYSGKRLPPGCSPQLPQELVELSRTYISTSAGFPLRVCLVCASRGSNGTLVAVPSNSVKSLCTRGRSILKGFLATGFLTAVASLSDGLVSATLEVYGKVEREMLPTPSRPHYTFNLRDISKVVQASYFRVGYFRVIHGGWVASMAQGKPLSAVVALSKGTSVVECLEFLMLHLFLENKFVCSSQGILLVKHQSIQAPAGMVRLWMHEMSRVFGDRLADPPHRVMFEHMLIEAAGRSVLEADVSLWHSCFRVGLRIVALASRNELKTVLQVLTEADIALRPPAGPSTGTSR